MRVLFINKLNLFIIEFGVCNIFYFFLTLLYIRNIITLIDILVSTQLPTNPVTL